MNLNQDINGTSRLCLPMCKKIINTDISEDFTLPDYYPEIRRVLYVKESPLPPAKFISGNKLDVNGTVDYTVVYVSNEGRLCSVPFSSEYNFSITLDSIGDFEISEGVGFMVHSIAESSTVRVSAPRKLQIRSRLCSTVNAWGKVSTAESIEGIEDPSSIQRLCMEEVCADIICESSDIVTLEDEYQLPNENCRIALADTAVYVESCRIDGELVRVKGEVALKMLIACDGESTEKVVRKLPFEAESDLDGIDGNESDFCRASGSVTDITLNVEEGKVSISADLVLEICIGQNKRVNYTGDIYSTEQNVDTVMTDESLPIILENRNFNFSQSERIPLEELNFTEGAEIVDACASASVDEVIFEDGKYILRGNCKYNVICLKDGEYSYCEAKAPFRYELDGDADIDTFDVTVDVFNCRARNDSDSLNVDAELCGACTLIGAHDVTMLEKATFSDMRDSGKNVWTVCYVQESETVWSVAKRYGVCAEDVKGDPTRDRFLMIER